jgi:hypothetical protein
VTEQKTNVPIVSSKLTKVMRKYNNNVCVALKNRKTVNNLYSVVKDRSDKLLLSKLIYCIECGGCPKEYRGLTFKQTLGTRSYQHEGDCRAITKCAKECNVVGSNIKQSTNELIQDCKDTLSRGPDPLIKKVTEFRLQKLTKLSRLCEKSGLTEHFSSTGHVPKFSEANIITRSDNRFKLGILEMINIKRDPGMNKCRETANLNPAYFGLIESTGKKGKGCERGMGSIRAANEVGNICANI